MKKYFLSLIATGLLFAQSPKISAAEISVLALTGTKEAIEELIPAFEKSSGHKLTVTWTGSVDVRKKIAAGEVFDVIVMAHADLDAFSKQGKAEATSVSVGSIMLSGDADIGFQQIPEIFEFLGVTYIGPLPSALQNTTQFAGGVSVHSKQPAVAKTFIAFLASPEAAQAIRHHGMEPG
jgi:ABC-type molybdate transport system substrate-binding protein